MTQPSIAKSLFRPTGQSLIEVIVAVAVAGVLILASGGLSNLSSLSSSRNRQQQAAYALAEELLDRVAAYADAKWYCVATTCAATRGVYNLTKGSSRRYYLASNPLEWREDLAALPNGESVVVSGASYNRYFYLENVCRATSDGAIVGVQSGSCPSGSAEDPSTQKTTVAVRWLVNGQVTTFSLDRYIVRTRTAAVVQTDWSGGPWAVNCTTIPNNAFASNELRYGCDDGNITNNEPAGSVKVKGY